MTSPRPVKTFRKKPQEDRSWASRNVVLPSLASSGHPKVEPAESSRGVKINIVGFRKRKVAQPKLGEQYRVEGAFGMGKSRIFPKEYWLDQSEFKRLLDELVEKKITELLGVAALGSPDRLKAARSRGNAYKTTELAKPENAQLKEASIYSGTSDRVINKWRNDGSVYALVQEGKSRGFRYPLWQFDADRNRLSRVLGALREVNASDWVIHNFLLRPNSFLDGRSPRDWILDPGMDIEHLIKVAKDRFSGDQGAS
jgi:hypothetical protein